MFVCGCAGPHKLGRRSKKCGAPHPRKHSLRFCAPHYSVKIQFGFSPCVRARRPGDPWPPPTLGSIVIAIDHLEGRRGRQGGAGLRAPEGCAATPPKKSRQGSASLRWHHADHRYGNHAGLRKYRNCYVRHWTPSGRDRTARRTPKGHSAGGGVAGLVGTGKAAF